MGLVSEGRKHIEERRKANCTRKSERQFEIQVS
jgi:hypothetical protein